MHTSANFHSNFIQFYKMAAQESSCWLRIEIFKKIYFFIKCHDNPILFISELNIGAVSLILTAFLT